MFKILKILPLFLLFLSTFSLASELKPSQIETLTLVKQVASKFKNKKGESFEKTAMAICLTETSAGVFKVGDIGKDPNIFKASLGLMQVRLETARFIAEKFKLNEVKAMSDVKLVNKLLSDDKFNVEMAVRFIIWLNETTDYSYFRTVSRYNGGENNKTYYQKVINSMQLITTQTDLMKDL